MPFSNTQKRSIKGAKECVWCGWKQSYLDAVHLVDEIQQPSVNGVWMCKNCHAVFEGVFRPLLYKALVAYHVPEDKLPPSWKKCNKLTSVPAEQVDEDDAQALERNGQERSRMPPCDVGGGHGV